ncbi:MAG: 4-hydroxy-2-oxovalerate aldolase [Rhodospirillaceae bacterium]|nr:4-hydroxy-2-oxovalerate aldolase [Rhodospirillaceae bacterium]|tara:strand:- start:4981 stop:5739 length:759 start_codon:yes stop_codon:yes gene_type:complete
MAKPSLKSRKVTFTFWLSNPSTAAVEAAKITGCDGITLDLEHGAFDRTDVDRLNLLAHESGLKCFSRVAEPTRIAIQQSLDSGADGVIIPHVENLAHAAELADYAKYPPLGDRSVGGGRTFGYGGLGGPKFYAAQNRRVRCYPMVETVGALNDVVAILKLKTVDGIFLGPADLNMARGRKGVFGRADSADRKRVSDACMAAGKDFGMNVFSRDDMRASRDIGLTFAALTDDVSALIAGVGAVVDDARKIIGR